MSRARAKALAISALGLPLTLLGLVLVTFLIGRVVPADPALAALGERASPEAVARLRAEMGLDRPLVEQFLRYVGELLRGELGASVVTGNAVIADIAACFPATLELATTAMLLATAIGVPLGVLAATRQGGALDHLIRVFGLVGHALPVFVLGMLSLLVFYAALDWAPGPGRQGIAYLDQIPVVTGLLALDAALAGDAAAARDALAHLVQPAGVLAVFSLAYIARMTRALMLAELGSEYVLAARALGLSSKRIVWGQAFANIRVPLLTVLVLTYAGLLEGAVLTETVFSWPGLGQYLTRALLNADMNAVLGATLVVGVVYVAFNRLADALYPLLDPRAR
ncbi:MAG: ABC transporter permease [Alphaproteobacteria bacterium]|nr:ABC transporter permease [Alphaproteobacteria bacterium]